MDNVQLSQANLAHINNQTKNKNVTSPIQPQVRQVEDGENKMNKVLVGLGILGAAAIGITCVIRGRKPKNTPDVQKLIKQFQDIDFNNGQAKLKDGTLFTGAIEDTLKSGEKITMEYVDGILQKSTKTTNGVEVVKEYTNGVISKKNGEVVDIKKVQNEVKKDQEKLKQLLKNNELSSVDFKKQTDEIKFKSNNDKKAINETFDKKVQSEEAAKAEAERLAREAQEKAEKEEAERIAKKQAEKVAKEVKERQKAEFKKSLEEMSDEDFEKIKKEIQEEYNIALEKAKEIAKKRGVESNNISSIEMVLSKNELEEFQTAYDKNADVLNAKIRRNWKSKCAFVNKLLRRDGDKPLKAPSSNTYLTDKELKEFNNYYDSAIGNLALRGQDGPINFNPEIMMEGFKKAPPLEEDAVVFRGISPCNLPGAKEFLENFKEGFIFTDKGFMSTSSITESGQFHQFINDNGIAMRIHLPKGTKGVYGGYYEYLLPMNSTIKVNKIEVIDGIKVADCEYILPQN